MNLITVTLSQERPTTGCDKILRSAQNDELYVSHNGEVIVDLTIPKTPADMTAEWLTAALRETKTITGAKVASFDVEPDIAAGSGFMGQLARVALRYDAPEPGAPASLIAKFPMYDPENRGIADLFRMYETETRFYEEIARQRRAADAAPLLQRARLRLHGLHPAHGGPRAGARRRPGRRLRARSRRTGDPRAGEVPRDLVGEPAARRAGLGVGVQQSRCARRPRRARTRRRGGHSRRCGARRCRRRCWRWARSSTTRCRSCSTASRSVRSTITHGDYRLDNLFFATPEGGDPLAVVDWQIISLGMRPLRCGVLHGGRACRRRTAGRCEMDLLHMYHDMLVAARREGVRLRPVPARLPDGGAVLLAVRGHHPGGAGRVERARPGAVHRRAGALHVDHHGHEGGGAAAVVMDVKHRDTEAQRFEMNVSEGLVALAHGAVVADGARFFASLRMTVGGDWQGGW